MVTYIAYYVLAISFLSMGISISEKCWREAMWQFNTACWVILYLVKGVEKLT